MKTPGYNIVIKAFVPSSKTDFKKQAEAATLMATLTGDKSLPEDFNDIAIITDISAKFGAGDDGTPEPA